MILPPIECKYCAKQGCYGDVTHKDSSKRWILAKNAAFAYVCSDCKPLDMKKDKKDNH